jgi:hypothetical protein
MWVVSSSPIANSNPPPFAGSNVTLGSDNILLGGSAGYNLEKGSNNIYLGASGTIDETSRIRIGTAGSQTTTYIAGIAGTPVTGAQVVVTSSGQLGVLASSERYKTDIRSMDVDVAKLEQVRPVTFHLRSEPKGTLQYGLIAEEVDKVYPDLVVRNEAGRIEGVRYDERASILLTEVQSQRAAIGQDDAKFAAEEQRLAAQQQQLDELKQQFAQLMQVNKAMQAALAGIAAKDSQTAMR